MTLFIAIILIHGFGQPWWMYAAATVLWIVKKVIMFLIDGFGGITK